jgi:hypothetical protein
MARMVQANRQATNSEIMVQYNSGVEDGFSGNTTCPSFPQMGYCSKQPHLVPLVSVKNKKWLQWVHYHQHWRIEDWKTIAWSGKSRFLSRHADGRDIWREQHESIDLSCLVSKVQLVAVV